MLSISGCFRLSENQSEPTTREEVNSVKMSQNSVEGMVPLAVTSHEVLSPRDYVSWVRKEGNGLTKVQSRDLMSVQCTYLPQDYMVCMELKQSEIDQPTYEETLKHYSGSQYFKFRVSGIKESDNLTYLMTHMQHDIKLVIKQDTIPCIEYICEPMISSTAPISILVGFDLEEPQDMQLIIKNQQTPIEFNWLEEDIKNAPKLKKG